MVPASRADRALHGAGPASTWSSSLPSTARGTFLLTFLFWSSGLCGCCHHRGKMWVSLRMRTHAERGRVLSEESDTSASASCSCLLFVLSMPLTRLPSYLMHTHVHAHTCAHTHVHAHTGARARTHTHPSSKTIPASIRGLSALLGSANLPAPVWAPPSSPAFPTRWQYGAADPQPAPGSPRLRLPLIHLSPRLREGAEKPVRASFPVMPQCST